jgi:hypothetical protein
MMSADESIERECSEIHHSAQKNNQEEEESQESSAKQT